MCGYDPGSVWGYSSVVEHLTADQEVPGSNPGAPYGFGRLGISSCLLVLIPYGRDKQLRSWRATALQSLAPTLIKLTGTRQSVFSGLLDRYRQVSFYEG